MQQHGELLLSKVAKLNKLYLLVGAYNTLEQILYLKGSLSGFGTLNWWVVIFFLF